MGVTKQEEKEKRVLGDRLLPLPLTPREEAWTTEEAWKGSLKGRFPLVSRVSLVASARGAAPGCPALDPSLDPILRLLDMSPKRLDP